MGFIVKNKKGKIIREGDAVVDFRGDKAVFKTATRANSDGRDGKVILKDRMGERYAGVFDLTVEEAE